jgi:hypothetical protein
MGLGDCGLPVVGVDTRRAWAVCRKKMNPSDVNSAAMLAELAVAFVSR